MNTKNMPERDIVTDTRLAALPQEEPPMTHDYLISLIRTAVPAAVGALLA